MAAVSNISCYCFAFLTGLKELREQLIAFCAEHLARHKCPRSFDFVDELPRLPTGKLYKKPLRDDYWKGRNGRII